MTEYKNIGIIKPTVSSYVWEIKNFCFSCKNTGDKLISPVFSTMHSSAEHKWRLHMYPKGKSEQSKDYVPLYLKYLEESSVDVHFTLSFLDDKGGKVVEDDYKLLFQKGSTWGNLRFAKQNFVLDKKNRVLVNDTINILCEIVYDSKLSAASSEKECDDKDFSDYCRLKEFDEFEKLLDVENSTADVTIRIGKNEIKVHKAIIMSRSPVFQAMFELDMKEKEQSLVEIADVKYEVMKEVCRFMYVAKVNEIEKIAEDLLVAADKYSIKGLKVMCEKQLFKNLTVANSIEYLKLADLCNAIKLKSKIIEFLVSKKKETVDMPELKSLPSALMFEVYRAVVFDD